MLLPGLAWPAHQVDADLRVSGLKNVFAVGDVNNVKETKLGYLAGQQAEVAAKNIKTLIGGGGGKLATWAPSGGMPSVMMVTLGARDGVGHMGSCACTGCIPTMMKSKDLFVGKYRKIFGVKD